MEARNLMLEVCIDSVESALAAERGGATRLEVCADLVIGGTTPSPFLVQAAKRETGMPVHAMVRPRFGDFLYTEMEFSLMLQEAAALLEAGADALVCGCLTADGDLDLGRMEQLIGLAHKAGKTFTLHRAFDVCRNPLGVLKECRDLGVDAILTSGQSASCLGGVGLLKKLWQANEEQGGGMELIVAAGVNAKAIRRIRQEIPQAGSFHMSGKRNQPSGMSYQKPGVNMGLPGISEFTLWRTDEGKVREAWEALNEA